ncbi:MAG TPA: hypothetical protein VLD86_03020, partial [Ilumatobacteraceae bacterium]|nr:hypothetical protein [Ilumatobacteraceae bacterium]
MATPDGDFGGGNIYEYLSDQTFLLSVGGGVPKLVTVRFADPSHTDIGFNNGQAAAASPLIAPSAPTVYDVTGDADFTVTVRKDDGTEESFSFTLTATETDGNLTVAHLAQDIDDQMIGSTVYPLVIVTADGDGHIRFSPLDGTSAIRVQASGTATSEIGFAADATSTLGLLGAGAADADLSDAARFKLTLKTDTGGGTSTTTYSVVVPDNNRGSLNDLAADINAAIDSVVGADRIDVFVSDGKVLLKAIDADVLAFSVTTINENLADLVGDVNQALAKAGLAGQVTASDLGGQLALTATGGKSLEISHTLTFDAGVTYAELAGASTDQLFDVSEDTGASHVKLKLPVHVLPGLYDDFNDLTNWNPANVAIVGNFDPFDSAAAEFVGSPANRFDLLFDYTPGVEDQDLAPIAVPSVNSLSNEIRLVNFGEVLNFNVASAESIIGLLGGLGTALQQLSETPTFSSYGIAFADATLSDLLNFADGDKAVYSGLIDTLLFDTGGDGVDGSNPDHDGLLKKISVDSTSYLLPAFTTAQKLATRLDALLDGPLNGAGGINATYNTHTNELTYQLDLRAGDRTAVDTTVSFEHDVPLDPFSKLAIDAAVPPADTSVELRGRTGLDLTFGVDLSLPGVVIYPDTPLAELNGSSGIDVRVERAVTGESGVRSVFGITRDSKFKIAVDGGPSYDVTLSAGSTNNNTSIWNLVGDLQGAIDVALSGTGYAGKVQVGLDGATLTRLGMQHADGAGHTIKIYVDSSDPFVTEMGFPNRLTSGEPTPFTILVAQKPAPLLVGRLSGLPTDKATFEIDILKDRFGVSDLAGPIAVEVTAAQTAGNVSPADLVADVDNALAAAGLHGVIKAAYDNSTSQGTRLVLVAGDGESATDDSLIEFTVRATNTKAHTELGLPNAATAANQADFVIYDRAGNAHPIVLDGLPNNATVDDLLQRINASFPDPDDGGPLKPLVIASLNDLHTGLKLVTSADTGSAQFRVETINDSPSLIGMGLFLTGDDPLPNTFNNGDPKLIQGGAIGLNSLDERFFVRDAQLRIDGLEVKTPDAGVPGQGLYGIVGVDVNVKGGLLANVTAQLTDPNNDDTKNQITLAELLDKKTGGTVATPIVSPVVELSYDNQSTGFPYGEFAVGGRLFGSDAGDSAVIVG